jgi:hypothetical protein
VFNPPAPGKQSFQVPYLDENGNVAYDTSLSDCWFTEADITFEQPATTLGNGNIYQAFDQLQLISLFFAMFPAPPQGAQPLGSGLTTGAGAVSW